MRDIEAAAADHVPRHSIKGFSTLYLTLASVRNNAHSKASALLLYFNPIQCDGKKEGSCIINENRVLGTILYSPADIESLLKYSLKEQGKAVRVKLLPQNEHNF